MNAVGFVILGLLLALVLFAPKRWALLGVIGGVLYLTSGQWIDVFDLHIYPIRVLALGAFVRVLVRGEWSFSALNDIDKAFLMAYGYRTVVFILNSNGSTINALGLMVDVTIAYFACRGLLTSFDDLKWFLRALALLLVPYVAVVSVEAFTGHNPFVIVGGIDEPAMRSGRPRCVASFAHALILGTFGASFMPLFFALCLIRRWRLWGAIGMSLCLAIVFFSNSSGPLICAMLALIGWLFWFSRAKMSSVRVGIVTSLVLLGLAMNAPVWYLPAKISDLLGSGDGWHRSYLMDVALGTLSQWWLAGMSVLATKDWFPYRVVTGGADVINYYLDFGVSAGVAATSLFLFLLVRAFSRLGRALHAVRSTPSRPRDREFLLWALGVVLSIHVFNWFGLVYFDQYIVVFLMQLAALSTLSYRCIHGRETHHQARVRIRDTHQESNRPVPQRPSSAAQGATTRRFVGVAKTCPLEVVPEYWTPGY